MQSFTQEDLSQLETLGIPPEKIGQDIERYRNGFPFTRLDRPCRINDGIKVIQEKDCAAYISAYDTATADSRLIKMVPASGAATRMFAFLQYALNTMAVISPQIVSRTENSDRELIRFMECFRKFPFLDELRSSLQRDHRDLENELRDGRFEILIEYILHEKGLNLSQRPKALIPFHRYKDHTRTAMEEHLVEAIHTVRDRNDKARIHFTISPEHRKGFDERIKKALPRLVDNRIEIDITFSYQLPSTQTIAVNDRNEPVRDVNGRLVFRPAGHGTLISNLNDLKADVVFIKNIDNTVPDHLKEPTYRYKKILAGYLLTIEEKIRFFLKRFDEPGISRSEIQDCVCWMENDLIIPAGPMIQNLIPEKQIQILRSLLHRPIRVCGMVKNEGEPGGGPFWTIDQKGNKSRQIVEKHQIDINDPAQKWVWESSTHFNPVDIVCSLRDHQGIDYDLMRFIDPDTGFISTKFRNGNAVRALELPGLWNGAMADWITLFAEVPLITFNPVKTINDLLRQEHQAGPI